MTIWREHAGWVFRHFEPDMDPALLPRFAGVIAMWQAKRAGRRVPSWADFDFFDFKGWHGWVNVYDVRYDPFDYTVRLAGSHVEELYGVAIQGHDGARMNEIYAETELRDAFDEQNCRNLLISHIAGPLNVADKTYRQVEYLELPLSDDGERATHTVEIVYPVRTSQTLADNTFYNPMS